jgi:hypothetical protein
MGLSYLRMTDYTRTVSLLLSPPRTVTFRPSTEARSSAMIGAKMNWSFLIGPIVFLVVLAAVRGAFPRATTSKQPGSPSALRERGSGDFDQASVPEFKSTWKDAR